MGRDPIDQLSGEWRAEIPDLDTAAMATVARLNRARALVIRRVEGVMSEAQASLADFDVLATLRRQGPPYEMMPSSLARSIMLSASGMTSRVDHLERAGLVRRVVDPTSRRTAPVALTAAGIAEAERLARLLVGVEEQLLSALTTAERARLDRLLSKLIAATEDSV